MRRSELATADPGLFQELAQVCGEGYLSLVTPEGFPRALAVNFALKQEAIFFHGALAGEKFEVMRKNSQVGFAMIQPLSFLPSQWSSPENACPASQLFRSVEVKGHCRILEDPAEKAFGLQALMEKYQPEGGHEPIAAEGRTYRLALQGTGVFRIDPVSWTGKVKLMQADRPETAGKIMALLEKRGRPLDLVTAQLMSRYRKDDGTG